MAAVLELVAAAIVLHSPILIAKIVYRYIDIYGLW